MHLRFSQNLYVHLLINVMCSYSTHTCAVPHIITICIYRETVGYSFKTLIHSQSLRIIIHSRLFHI